MALSKRWDLLLKEDWTVLHKDLAFPEEAILWEETPLNVSCGNSANCGVDTVPARWDLYATPSWSLPSSQIQSSHLHQSTGWHVSLSPILSWNQYRTQADVSPCSLTWMAQSEFFALPPFLYLLPRWKNHTNRVLRLISVEFSATWQLHFHWNPPEHAVFSLAEYVFG